MKVSVVPVSETLVDPPDSTTVKPGTSSSVVVTFTVWFATASNESSEASGTIEIVTTDTCEPSMVPASSTPVDVIVCGVSQFAEVKVIEAGETVDSATVPEAIERTTSSAGCAFRTIVKVSVVPDSSTLVDPSVSTMVNPATSLSVVDVETVWSATGSKLLSELASSTVMVMVEVMVPSTRLSSTPVTVTVLGVFQFSGLKVNGVFTVASPVSLEEIRSTTFEAG